jgi:hypothetical protein
MGNKYNMLSNKARALLKKVPYNSKDSYYSDKSNMKRMNVVSKSSKICSKIIATLFRVFLHWASDFNTAKFRFPEEFLTKPEKTILG